MDLSILNIGIKKRAMVMKIMMNLKQFKTVFAVGLSMLLAACGNDELQNNIENKTAEKRQSLWHLVHHLMAHNSQQPFSQY